MATGEKNPKGSYDETGRSAYRRREPLRWQTKVSDYTNIEKELGAA